MLSFIAECRMPTDLGWVRVRAYRERNGPAEPTATYTGDHACFQGKENVPVRVHDQCFTSEILGSKKCDCKEQLDFARRYFQETTPGVLIYLQQEGRGIGLANKIHAYSLQSKGYDTVDANLVLGLDADSREYDFVKQILEDMGIQSIQLMTNNPRKIDRMRQLGIEVSGRIPVVIHNTLQSEHSKNYMEAKMSRMGHLYSIPHSSSAPSLALNDATQPNLHSHADTSS